MDRRPILRPILVLIALLVAVPARAMVGGAVPSADGIGRSVVTIVGSRGNFCTGAAIAPDLVLTAAHCVVPGARYKVVDPSQRERLIDAIVETHPAFSLQTMLNHRATADVALLKLSISLTARPAPLGVPVVPIRVGARFTVAGVGVTRPNDESSIGQVRAASLAVTGRPGQLQIRLVDPVGQGLRAGLGACAGDSGAPVFEDQNGRAVIIGVVSVATAPNADDGCGGLTIVTPLTLYRAWIVQTAKRLGSPLLP